MLWVYYYGVGTLYHQSPRVTGHTAAEDLEEAAEVQRGM